MTRIAVMGAGATGGFFGGCLAHAGGDVTFIARGRHLEAIRSAGLQVESASLGSFTIKPAQATDDPTKVGVVDLILFCVKTWDLGAAAQALAPMVGPETVVIPLLNGVEAADQLSAVIGTERVLGGVAHIEVSLAAPGLIRHLSRSLYNVTFGELDGSSSHRAQHILRTLQQGRFNVELTSNIIAALWEKFVFICGLSGVSTVTRLPVGPIREEPVTRHLMEQAMLEVATLARRSGVRLGRDAVRGQVQRVQLLRYETKPSMARDIERGSPLEVEALNGTVVRRGHQLGMATPVNGFIYACLKPYALGPPGVQAPC